jgi:hypothetical protein
MRRGFPVQVKVEPEQENRVGWIEAVDGDV